MRGACLLFLAYHKSVLSLIVYNISMNQPHYLQSTIIETHFSSVGCGNTKSTPNKLISLDNV